MQKIKTERQKNNGRKCTIKVKVTHVPMIKFVEKAISKFNALQFEDGNGRSESVSSMFEKLGQSPWFARGDELFVEHLNKLKQNAHYKRDLENDIQNHVHEDMDADRLVFA